MKKVLLIVLCTAAIAILSVTAYSLTNSSSDKDTSHNDDSHDSSEFHVHDHSSNDEEHGPEGHGHGEYIDYSATAIAETKGTKILFFHAPWCPQCKMIEDDINRIGVPDNTTIIKVDYDTNQELRQKYGVTLQTTLVKVDNDGNLVSKYVAYDDPTVESIKTNLL